MTDIADALLAGSRAAPQLDPSMLYGVTQTSDINNVPDNATAVGAFGDITKRRSYLEAQDPNVQASAWASAGDSERQMLTNVGYKPPVLQKKSSGIFAAVGHFLGDVADATFVKPGEEIAKGVGEALHYAGAPLRQLQHAYRAAALITDTERLQGHGGFSPETLAATFDPSEWARMWRQSEHGEQTFAPVQLQKIQQQYDPQTLDLAKQIAGGTKPADIVTRAPVEDRQRIADQMQSDPQLHQAVADLNAAKISVGRRVLGPALEQKLTVTLPKSVPLLGGAKLNPVSGAIDAVADWFGDPLVVGGKITKGAEIARYLVQGPDDVERLANTSTQVQRALKDVTDTLNVAHDGEGLNVAALVNRWPKLAPVAAQLSHEGVDTPEKLSQWFQGQTGLSSLLSGRAGGALRDGVLMPHLSVVDQAALDAKGGLRAAVNWGDSQYQIARAVGDDETAGLLQQAQARATRAVLAPARAVRQLTTLTAKGVTFDATAANSVTTIQRLAGYVLPADRVDDVVNAWSAAPDLATKRQIYKGLIGEMGDAAGVTRTAEGRDWLAKFTSGIDDAVQKPIYSAAGADTVTRDGVEARRGLLENQLTTEWALPSFKDFYKQSSKVSTLSRLYNGTVNSDGVDTFMNQVWKPSTLLRLGFPIRAGGEELVGAIMREGPLGLIRGRLASSAAEAEAAGAADKLLPFHPFSAVWDRYSQALPDAVKSAVDTPADFVGAVIGDRTRRAFRAVEGKLAGQDYMNAARELWRAGPLQDAFAAEVGATESRAAGYLDDTPGVVKVTKEGGRARPAYMAPTGLFQEYRPQDDLYTMMWRKNLGEVSQSKMGQAALNTLSDGRDAQVAAVSDVLDSDGFARMRARADRSLYTRDGRVVGVDATPAEATQDWANSVVDHVNSLVHDDTGTPIPGLADRLTGGDVPSVADLSQTPFAARPGPVKGREMVAVSRNWARDIMDRGFAQVVGRPMDWMVRQPLFIHNYAVSLKEAEAVRPLIENVDQADELVRQVAVERALNKTVPFIHDPQMRSQFSVVTRNLAPFWFAQEQFYKRWANIAQHSPEAFRQAQLTMMGLRHAGVLHTDDQGNDYFLYPGPSVMQSAISKGFELATGHKVSVPLPVGFSGQVRFATPGLERLGVPSFGPLVGIPVHYLAQRFPELDTTEQGILGERGAGRAFWEQITPTTIQRLVHVAIDTPDTSPQMASAMMQAMAYLEANGFAPADNASPVEREAYLDRLKNWTRILFLNRTLFGFSVPASPELQLDPNQLHQQYRDLLAQLPIDQATSEFMKQHPDATPYTVFQSSSKSGAALPATQTAAKFMADNEAFLSTYPQASGWFIPQDSADKKFSLPAYREQLALQLRQRKTPDEFYSDVKFAEAADAYFQNRDRKDVMLEGVNGPTATKLRETNPALLQQFIAAGAAQKATGQRATQINQAWADWKQSFLISHPVFAEQLQAPDAQIKRQQALDQMHLALQDPRMPASPQNDAIRTLMGAYDTFQTGVGRYAGDQSTAADQARKSIRDAFATWAESYVTAHPEASGMYNKLIRPETET